MSLSEAEWKKVLDKPKNAGLKVVGTGISKSLRDVQDAMKGHAGDALLPRYHIEMTKAFDALGKQCDAVINKHGKLFTEACAYLQKVKTSAKDSATKFSKVRPKFENLYEARTNLKDQLTKLKAANTPKDVKKVLADIEKILTKGAKDSSKYVAFANDFRHLREAAWDSAKSGSAIHGNVTKTLKPAIEFTYWSK
jgi:hypothetical protein